jgi:hypothetical protein
MTFNTSDILKMHSLIWKPFVCFQDTYLFPFGEQLKMVKVGMTVKTNAIIIQDSLPDILTVPYINLIAVRIMAFPA